MYINIYTDIVHKKLFQELITNNREFLEREANK